MCGYAGILGFDWTADKDIVRSTLSAMTNRIAHRGPDAEGQWVDFEAGIALGHRRLAIVELSEAGSQPMISPRGRYVGAYNGEIYNHNDLRKWLTGSGQAPDWRGHSDTETLLACFDAWGVETTLERATGMFAFALWDVKNRQLILARDRLGEKPLYYGWQGVGEARSFVFGSELKALRAHPSFEADIDRDALALLMRHTYIPAPYSIYRNVHKLPPGSIAIVSQHDPEPRIKTYWAVADVACHGAANSFAGSPGNAVDALETLLRDAVGRQMAADVPLGAFLSGGIDSSTIVALMQAQSSQPVQSFSIGFHEEGYNEAEHAKAVARHLGTDHVELYVTPEQAMGVIPKLPALYDEPFADSSQIPTFLVSQLARSKVAVSLSGDAGDELFAGYRRYQITSSMWKTLSRIPRPARGLGAKAINSISAHTWNRVGAAIGRLVPAAGLPNRLGDKLHKGAGVLGSRDVDDLFLGLTSLWQNPTELVRDAIEPPTKLMGNTPNLTGLTDVERMMALDLVSYLPDDILTKVDRAAMGVSLETRVPFLDHRVVEFAWSLPMNYKIRNGQTKWALRQVLYRHVPEALVNRPKMGFGLPIDAWLRGSLRDWCEDLLDHDRLRDEGYFDADIVQSAWAAHQSGNMNLQYQLWPVLIFQQWLAANNDPVDIPHQSRSKAFDPVPI